ncbi:MAG: putative addiction module antidote protein [Candidatus Margulisbacteria bacterium]|jgi:probable addiction module antidote protein|nr:putative addiction module antidote protein [Candidatus Margulisiibacteriota bacterium]
MVKVYDYDFSKQLKTETDIKVYLETVFEDGDPAVIQAALGNVAKARRAMSKIARKSGVNRESLYKSLSKNTKPYFGAISSVVNALGYKLTVVPQRA